MNAASYLHIENFRKQALARRRLDRLEDEARKLPPIPDDEMEEYIAVTEKIRAQYEPQEPPTRY